MYCLPFHHTDYHDGDVYDENDDAVDPGEESPAYVGPEIGRCAELKDGLVGYLGPGDVGGVGDCFIWV